MGLTALAAAWLLEWAGGWAVIVPAITAGGLMIAAAREVYDGRTGRHLGAYVTAGIICSAIAAGVYRAPVPTAALLAGVAGLAAASCCLAGLRSSAQRAR